MFSSVFSLGLALLPFASAAIFDVDVGKAGLAFDPPFTNAAVGDQIVFHFHAKNHTVTQSSFADPCGPKEGGFDSGFVPVPANQTDNLPTFTITVNDTNPIWVYCKQAAKTPAFHCGQGMVYSVNCPAGDSPNSLDNFKKAALAVGASLSAAAAASTPTASGTPAANASPTPVASGMYGDATIAPAAAPVEVTQTVTVESSVWTTTYSSYANSPAATPASLTGNTIKVVVGGTGANLTFTPSNVVAAPRDIIEFEFHQKNHTVTQSTFADPCSPKADGFKSGFVPVADDATTFPTWSIQVNDTAPIWVFCGQKTPKNHCSAGMVFAINSDETAGSNRTFKAYQAIAEKFNVTSAASNSDPASSADPAAPSNGAVSTRLGGASIAIAALFATALML